MAVFTGLGSNTAPSFTFSSDTDTGVYSPGADQLAFSTGGGERARIDSAGRLLVGTSANYSPPSQNLVAQFNAVNTSTGGIAVNNWSISGSAPGGRISLTRSNASTAGTFTACSAAAQYGQIDFWGADGAKFVEAARITAYPDGTPGTDDMPGRLVFSTTADGASSPTEQLRITSDRYVRLASGTGGIQFNGDTAATNALDDYEEGNLNAANITVTWYINTAAFSNAVYTARSGRYVKVGKHVTVQLRLDLGGGTPTADPGGWIDIRGLPFVSNSNGDNYSTATYYMDAGANYGTVIKPIIFPNNTVVSLFRQLTSGSPSLTFMKNTDIGNDFEIFITVTYITT